ncbi:MAG: hypothetical protein ABEJ87_01370 [Candidatus Nanohalobium sp.]
MVGDSLKGGLDYITGHVDMSGEVYIIDVGRDVVHDDPIILSTWGEETREEDSSFVETVFPPEYLAEDFAPDENVHVAYDHGLDVRPGERRGEYSGVDFFDIDLDQRLRFREENRDGYRPDSEVLDEFYGLLS